MSLLNKVPSNQPATLQAQQLQTLAATVGFDWPTLTPAFAKLQEEIDELQQVITHTPDKAQRLLEEMGDVLFSCINIARKLALDPDKALDATNKKFRQRFSHMEEYAKMHKVSLSMLDLNQLKQLWQQAK